MKFEKLSENKIKITLNIADLKANDMDLHSFMSNTDESKSLFLSVLEKAEKDFGFSTENYHLKIETLALDNGNFILTITRSLDSTFNKRSFKVSRKIPKIDSTSLIYKFNSFDDFSDFICFINEKKSVKIYSISKKSILYFYNSNYYLFLDTINLNFKYLKEFTSSITEFAKYIDFNDALIGKLNESATIILKNSAIKNAIKYFK